MSIRKVNVALQRVTLFIGAMIVGLLVTGCGTTQSPTPTPTLPPPSVALVVNPSDTEEMLAGETVPIHADASGQDLKFQWSVTRGQLSAFDTPAVIYTAPDSVGADTVTVEVTGSGGTTTKSVSFDVVVPPTPTRMPAEADPPVPGPTATPAPVGADPPAPEPTATHIPAPVGVLRSCQEILDNGQSQGDDFYIIDPDGPSGRLDPFEVYCDMTRHEGGWTLYAYHTDGIKVLEVDRVTKSEPGVMQGERWRAVRDTMTTGMMFVDESGKVSTLSVAKLTRGNCQNVQNPESLIPPGPKSYIWHDEVSGCGSTGQDYSLIMLHGPSYGNYRTAGASLFQWSAEKFDVWPYKATASYGAQNELFYFIK